MTPFEPERYELLAGPAYTFDLNRRELFKLLGGGVIVVSIISEASAQESGGGRRLLIAVNYAGARGQCQVSLPFANLAGKTFLLRDVMTGARSEWRGDDLVKRGLFLDLPEWGSNVLEMAEL